MKKIIISSIVLVLFGIFCFDLNFIAVVEEVYMTAISNDKMIAVTEENLEELDTCPWKFCPEKNAKREKEAEELLQKKHKVLDIWPWKFCPGNLSKVVTSEKVIDSFELSDKAKRNFYICFVLVLLISTITIAGGELYASYRTTSLVLLLVSLILTSVFVFTSHLPKFDLAVLLIMSFVIFLFMGVILFTIVDAGRLTFAIMVILTTTILLLERMNGDDILISDIVLHKVAVAYAGVYVLEFFSIYILVRMKEESG